jgi:hypothetical protein
LLCAGVGDGAQASPPASAEDQALERSGHGSGSGAPPRQQRGSSKALIPCVGSARF